MPAARPSRRAGRAAGLLDAALGVGIGALAWWTVLFHLAVPLGWARDVVGGLWVAGLGLGLLAWRLVARRTAGPAMALVPVRVRPVEASVVAAGAVAVAALSGTRWLDGQPRWWALWAMAVAVGAGAVAVVVRATPSAVGDGPPSAATTASTSTRRRETEARAVAPEAGGARAPSAWSVGLVLAVAVVAAVGSAVTQRPDADDVFLVNRSTYVEQHSGALPDRDTIFADEVFAAPRPDAVPTSVEALVGVVAAWSPISAPTVTYLLLGPLVAAAAVLATWRLLRTIGAAAPALAATAAAAFVLLDGGQHAAFGNLHFARAWQGKVIFLTVVVPLLWHHGLRWARDGSRHHLALLAVAHVAAVGLTSTALFVAPAITLLAVSAGAWAQRAWDRLGWGVAAAAPTLVAAVAFAVLPRQDPAVELASGVEAWVGPFAALAAIDPPEQWHRVFGDGLGLVVPVAAVLVAWALVRDRAARLALALAPLALFAAFYAPGALDLLAEATGGGSVLWRTAWILPVPVAVGLLVTAPALLSASPARTALSVVVPLGVAATLWVGTSWVLDPANMGIAVGRPAWDVDPDARAAAEVLIELSEPGDVVLSPEVVGGVLAIRTTEVHPVNPRYAYMRGRHAVPEFLGPERDLASRAVTWGIDPALVEDLADAVLRLEVATACVAADLPDPGVEAALTTAGLAPLHADDHCTYWRRPG